MNDTLPLNIQKAIRKYEVVEIYGLRLHPIKVREYDELNIARPALEVMQQALPVRYMSMPLLQAYFQIDVIEAQKSGTPTGVFGCALLLLSLSLRLGEGMSMEKRMLAWKPVITGDLRLKSVKAVLDGEEVEINPAQFQKLRPIIAAQNGVRIESDDANPELVKAERDIAEINAPKLDITIEQMIASVAALTGADESDIDDWPILKLYKRSESIQRALDYMVCGIGGAFGGFGKGGNPVPHPFYERTDKASVHMALGDFANGAGERAVANAGRETR